MTTSEESTPQVDTISDLTSGGKPITPRDASLPPAAVDTPRTDYTQEFWWLIETQKAFVGTGKPGYATGNRKVYGFEWTLDPYQAMRFATEEAAQTVRIQYRLWEPNLGGYLDCEAVEHGFISVSYADELSAATAKLEACQAEAATNAAETAKWIEKWHSLDRVLEVERLAFIQSQDQDTKEIEHLNERLEACQAELREANESVRLLETEYLAAHSRAEPEPLGNESALLVGGE